MKKILLSNRKGIRRFAFVDDEDFEWLNQWKWHLSNNGYVKRVACSPSGKRTLFLQREITKVKKGQYVLSINGNKLDCRRENLAFTQPYNNESENPFLNDEKTGIIRIKLLGTDEKEKFALIDGEDFEKVRKYRWRFDNRGCGYASSKKISMHRLIMNAPKGMEVDHLNGDGLDNRKINLRICSHSENTKNRTRINKNNTSTQTGVYWMSHVKQWGVRFRKDYKLRHYGSYKNKEDAIKDAIILRKKLFNL